MNVGELKTRVEHLKLDENLQDSFGAKVLQWTTVSRFWAKIEPQKGREVLIDDKVITLAETKFTLRFKKDVAPGDRFKFKNKCYEIKSVQNLKEENKMLMVFAQEV